jgi:hypothetical protein
MNIKDQEVMFKMGVLWAIDELRKLKPSEKSRWSHSRDLDFAPVEISDFLVIQYRKREVKQRLDALIEDKV